MDGAELETTANLSSRMDRPIERPFWHWARWPLSWRVGATVTGLIAVVFILVVLIFDDGSRIVRMPLNQVTIATVESGVFRDFIPIRTAVVPRDTIYLDAIEGGSVERVLAEPGDMVKAGQPLVELGNTNLQLQVIQQESQLNQAISQLQQNEIALEQNKATNERTLADIEFNLTRLNRSEARRATLADRGAASTEELDRVRDELEHYRILKLIQVETNLRQTELRNRLLPDIHNQVDHLRQNLQVVRSKLDNLIVRAPAAGRVTSIDLKVGENRGPGQRLAEITPETGIKLSADIDEFYLARVREELTADIRIGRNDVPLTVTRVYPQVREGRFTIDLAFLGDEPVGLLPGQTLQGRLALGDDTQALILPAGAFLESAGGGWMFVLVGDGTAAERRNIKIGRRNFEQVEVLDGLKPGDRAIISTYTDLDRFDRIVLSN